MIKAVHALHRGRAAADAQHRPPRTRRTTPRPARSCSATRPGPGSATTGAPRSAPSASAGRTSTPSCRPTPAPTSPPTPSTGGRPSCSSCGATTPGDASSRARPPGRRCWTPTTAPAGRGGCATWPARSTTGGAGRRCSVTIVADDLDDLAAKVARARAGEAGKGVFLAPTASSPGDEPDGVVPEVGVPVPRSGQPAAPHAGRPVRGLPGAAPVAGARRRRAGRAHVPAGGLRRGRRPVGRGPHRHAGRPSPPSGSPAWR